MIELEDGEFALVFKKETANEEQYVTLDRGNRTGEIFNDRELLAVAILCRMNNDEWCQEQWEWFVKTYREDTI